VNGRFAARLAVREARGGFRRLGIYAAAIGLGVMALVALRSFRADVARSVEREARSLLGADARLTSSRAFPDSVVAVLDSLAGEGAGVARSTMVASLVGSVRSGEVRLLQVHGVEPGFPYYGDARTEPPDAWPPTREGALVDPAVLVQLDTRVGDTLRIGALRVPVAGTVEGLPTDVGFTAALGPRVFLAAEHLRATGLLGFGSLAEHRAYVRLRRDADAEAFVDRYREAFREARVSLVSAQEHARGLTDAVDALGRFLGLVGLAALLLGGIGVGSAVHVYVRGKRAHLAVLRCLGATQNTLFASYALQAAGLGLVGAALGAVAGVAVQHALPAVVGGALGVRIEPVVSWSALAAGIAIGTWVALVFALGPLLGVRQVSPLAALRHDVDPDRRALLRARVIAALAVVASVAALALLEAPSRREAAAFTLALAGSTAVLAALGWVLMRVARAVVPARAAYPLRQGVRNLFRPANQTVAVTLVLGSGAFVIGAIGQVEGNLVERFSLEGGAGDPNAILFDIQPDQAEGVRDLLGRFAQGTPSLEPIVRARLSAIRGVPVDEALERAPGPRPEAWAVRREYRHTARDSLTRAETLVAGAWWDEAPPAPTGVVRVSVEDDVARALRVDVGDRLTWDIAGRAVETVIASRRTVDWARFETNFFFVFEPGGLEGAPWTAVAVARIASDERLAELQRALLDAFPNVSVLDLSRLQETLDRLLARLDAAVRFLGGFATVGGLVVLLGAMAATRAERVREGALLRTLGARRGLVVRVLAAEYALLGTLATACGLLLALAAAWALVRFGFEEPFRPRPLRLAAVWAAVVGATLAAGLLGGRGTLERPPLEVLRETEG